MWSHSKTYENQDGVEVVVILLVKIPVVLVRLSVEHLVEMPAGVHLWWFARSREPFQHQVKGAQSLIESGKRRFSLCVCSMSMGRTYRFRSFSARS